MYDVYQRIAILSGAFLTMGESDNHSIQFNIDQVYRLNSDSATALRVTGAPTRVWVDPKSHYEMIAPPRHNINRLEGLWELTCTNTLRAITLLEQAKKRCEYLDCGKETRRIRR